MEQYKTLLQQSEYSFLQSNEHLGKHVILLALSGSYSYGTNVDGSDIDIRGITLNQKSDLIGFTQFDQYVDDHTDTVIYAFNRIISLFLDCKPNIIELLGLKPEHYLYVNEIGQMLLDNKKLFLSKKVIRSFEACAADQLRKLQNALANDALSQTVFRAGRLFEELSITYTSQTWSGKQWQRELHHYVDEMTGFGYRDWIIRKALEIAQDLIDKKKADMRSAKYATWHQFAGNFASSLQDLENNGLNAEEAEEIVLEAAETALRAVAPDVNGLKKNKTFSASDYLYVYKKEYIRCKEFSVPKETQDSSQKQKTQEEDVYVDDGRPVIEQYLLYQALKRPRTEVGFGQIPTGEAKSYTIEEIICKAIKGVPGYVELFDRYDRIIVTTIQNKLIASESLCTKHKQVSADTKKAQMFIIFRMTDVFFVRENEFTVVPFICKYAREWERVIWSDHFEEEANQEQENDTEDETIDLSNEPDEEGESVF